MKMKRILSFLLVFILCMTMFPAMKVSAVTPSSVEASLTSWRSNLNGKYWNYYDRSVYDSKRSYVQSQLISIATSGILSNSNATDAQVGVTSSACAGPLYESGCRSNYFAGAWQCRSFARFIDYALFGSTWAISSSGWTQFSGSALNSLTLLPGDHIVSSGHEAIIWKSSNGKISCVECWGSSGCKINYSSGFNGSQYTTASGLLSYLVSNGGSVWRHDSVNAECTTHTKGSYLKCDTVHPHYNYYRCSVCGSTFTDGSTTTLSSCETCNPKEYNIYYYIPEDTDGNRWILYQTETGVLGSTHTVSNDYPQIDQRYFAGWSYKLNPSSFDLRPGDSFEVCANTDSGGEYSTCLYAYYIDHEDVISGDPVLIYSPDDFTDNDYKLTPVSQTITQREYHLSLGDWSEWSTDPITSSHYVEVETSVVYRYYYFLCNKCGDHNPLSGNCGCGGTSNDWHQVWLPIPYNQSNSSVVSYATYKRKTTSLGDGQLWYFSAGNLNDTTVGTIDSNGAAEIVCNGYRSRTHTLTTSQKSKTVTAYKAVANHVHSMSHVTAQAATCTAAGNTEYWRCSGCGKYYLDANGTNETTAAKVILSALGHSYSNGTCTRCGLTTTVARYLLTSTGGCPGQEIKVTLSIADNPGIIALRQTIAYDTTALELTGVKNLGLLSGYTQPSPTLASPYTLRWADSLATSNNAKNGAIAELTFRILDQAKAGSYTIQANHVEARNVSGSKLSFQNTSAQVTVYDYLPGDLDGDGEVTDWDGILLNRYLAGWSVSIRTAAADVDGDGEVSDWDGILLDRYLAGWQITLGAK